MVVSVSVWSLSGVVGDGVRVWLYQSLSVVGDGVRVWLYQSLSGLCLVL